jgi:hypothetical protein
MPKHETERWLNLVEAAAKLGTTPEAVRMRAKRGTLESEKRDDGRLYVRVVADYTEGEHREGGDSSLVEQLRSEVEYLRDENRRKDSIIMQMAQRMPELETHEASEDHAQEAPEETERSGIRPGLGERLRDWWRRG